MLTLTKTTPEEISLDVLERLYAEAYPYISEERKRMGDAELKSALIDQLHDFPIIRYDLDGYTIGVCSYNDQYINGKKYLLHRHPIYGHTQTGSRGWWYSEEFQQKNSEYVRAEGFAGVVTLFNPSSPAAKAVLSHFGSFNKYYKTPTVYDDPKTSIGITLHPNADGILKAMIIDLMEE